jgi:proline racemase
MLISELQMAGVIVMATPEGDLELDAPQGVLSQAKLTVLREHKAEIVRLLSRRCFSCKKRTRLKTEEAERGGLRYFDTSCLRCGEVVEIFLPPRQNLANIENTIG